MAATDVLVSTHGAGLANMGFLRPGAAVVELRPSKFAQSNGDRYYRALAAGTAGALRWWALRMYGKLEVPGAMEAAGAGNPDTWTRDRDLWVPWAPLQRALALVLGLGEGEWVVAEAAGRVFSDALEAEVRDDPALPPGLLPVA
jgi:hypothetical protein